MNDRRNYPLLLASQFLSAFGDNLILMLILGPFLDQLKTGKITAESQSINNIFYTSLLFVPFVALAPLAGYLNDRFSKNRCLLAGNLIKVVGAGMVAFGAFHGSAWLAAGYLVVGIGAAVYSPAKYGILPEILPQERLVKANGSVELLTLVAILTGNISGAEAFDHFQLPTCYTIVSAVYILSLVLNIFMHRTPSYPEIRIRGSMGEFVSNLHDLFAQKRLARVIAGTSLFWVCGAILKMNFQPWGQQILHLSSMPAISLLGLWLSLGLMVGSVVAGQLYVVGDLHATRRNGWLLAGGIAVLGCLASVKLAVPILILTGFVAGLYLIPLNAALQSESHKDKLGKTIATQGCFENFAMLSGSVLAYADVKHGFNPSQLLLALAVFAALVVVWLKIPGKGGAENANLG